MQGSLALEQMSVEEKIKAMEELWADLSKSAEGYDSPLWHREVLECREAEGGEFINWAEAKQRIRNDTCK